MSERVVLSVVCVYHRELLGALTRRLFELGCNLAETTFAALAGTAEFTTVCELPSGLDGQELRRAIQSLPEIAGGRVSVVPYEAAGEAGVRHITHRFELTGPDAPGELARLVEALDACGAEIVRVNTHTRSEGEARHHVIRIAAHVPHAAAARCLDALAKAAAEAGLALHVEEA